MLHQHLSKMALLAFGALLAFAPGAHAQLGGAAVLLPLRGQSAVVNSFRVDVALRSALEAIKPFELSSKESTAELIETAKQLGLTCADDDVACYVKVGLLADLKWMIDAKLVEAAGRTHLRLQLIDVGAGRVAVEVERDVTPDATLLTRHAVYELLGQTGTVTITTSQAGARVLVDGEDRGTSPLPHPLALAVGAHTISATLEGFSATAQSIKVQLDQSAQVTVPLTPVAATAPSTGAGKPPKSPSYGLDPLVFYSVAGVSALAALVTVGALSGATYGELGYRDPAKTPDERTKAQQVGQLSWIVAIGASVAAVGGGITAGILWTQTDFE